MNYYNKNLEYLKIVSEILYKKLIEGEEERYSVEIISEDPVILKRESIVSYLHSTYDENLELEMAFKDVSNDVEEIIFLGIGSGEVFNYVSNKFKKVKRIIIIEPSLKIFKNFLKTRDITKLLSKLGAVFFVNEGIDFVASLLTKIVSKESKIEFAGLLVYKNIYEFEYKKIKERFLVYVRTEYENMRIVSTHINLWLKNTFYNLKEEAVEVEKLKPYIENKRILIVAAGPSLNKQLEIIKKLKENIIIVAVGSAIRILEHCGIKPHFRVAYDGHPNEYKVIEDVDTSDVPLIYTPRLYYEVVKDYKGSKVYMSIDADQLSKYIYKKIGVESESVITGPSITNVAFDLFCRLGSSEIVFVGMDLCYYPNKTKYAEGGRKNEEEQKFDTTHLTKVRDIYGKEVYTNQGFLLTKSINESILSKYSNVKVFNATIGGLEFKGAESVTIEDYYNKIKNLEYNLDFENIIKNMKKMNLDNVNSAVKEFKLEVEKLRDRIKTNVSKMKKAKKFRESKISKNRIISIHKEVKMNLDKMSEMELVKKVILFNLRNIINGIHSKYHVKNLNTFEEIEKNEKYILGILTEYHIFILYLLENIENFLGDVYE